MAGMFDLMKQAQAMQAKMQDVQAELERVEVEGQSAGGMVRVTLTAKGQMKGVTLDPSLLKPEDKDMLEDLIVAAHDDARKKGRTGDGRAHAEPHRRPAFAARFQAAILKWLNALPGRRSSA